MTLRRPVTISAMKLFYAIFVWLGMGAAIGWGIYSANQGNPWILVVTFALFVIAVGKIGCATHS